MALRKLPLTAARPARVLLLCPLELQGSREIVEGISEYGHGPGQWDFLHSAATMADNLDRFGGDADGIICQSTDRGIWSRLGRCKVPVVTLLNPHDGSRFPVVRDDEDALAELALGHLRDIGLKRVGFLDYAPVPSFRAECLRRHADAMQLEWSHFGLPYQVAAAPWQGGERRIGQWVRGLRKPVGIVTFAAEQGRNLAAACRLAGIAVPEEVAILSVGDELACRLAIPPLSGLDMNYRRLGWQAATLLDQMLHGRPPSQRVCLNRAARVICRGSTDVLHTGSPWVAQGLRFIRAHLADGIKADDVVRSVGTSRRVLEYAFRTRLGRSVHQEILRQQVERARDLLTQSDMLMVDIAEACGVADRTRLTVLFRRSAGMTPRQFRSRYGSRRGRGAGMT